MAAGKKLSAEICRVIVRMKTLKFHPWVISAITSVSIRSIERVMAHYRRTGTVPETAKKRPRAVKRTVTTEQKMVRALFPVLLQCLIIVGLFDEQFLYRIVTEHPDIYLLELQEKLMLTFGVRVHPSTIWRALTLGGLSKKKVRSISDTGTPIMLIEPLSFIALQLNVPKKSETLS